MRLRYTPQALVELDDILSEIGEQSHKGANRVRRRLYEACERLADFPRSGQPMGLDGLRRLTISPHPYLIFYLLEDDGIVVIAVRHAARDPASMPG